VERTTAQRQDRARGTVAPANPRQPQSHEDADIPERWTSDDAYTPDWSSEQGRDPSTSTYQEGPMTRAGADDHPHTTAMVAFIIPDDVAKEIERQVREVAGDEAVAWNQLHCTLCCFDAPPSDDEADLVVEIVRRVCREYGPVTLRFTGFGQFDASDSSDGVYPLVALVDGGSALTDLRAAIVNALEDAGVPVRKNFGFQPHVTVAYLTESLL